MATIVTMDMRMRTGMISMFENSRTGKVMLNGPPLPIMTNSPAGPEARRTTAMRTTAR
ncbi:hypothetical protein D3C86_1027280 [compost metagenome]